MATNAKTEYRYNRLSWPDMNDAIAAQKLVILPTGSTEQHGKHLPIDVDVFLCETVCLEVGKRAPDQVLVLPPVSYGLNLHHIDLPGTIHIEPEVFIAFCLNITKSVAYHGFQKILIVNGHGSNTPLIDLVARKTVLQTKSLCFATNYFSFASEAFEKLRETKVKAHADEFETSLYLHLAADRVRMDLAVEDNDRMGNYLSSDSTSNYPVRFSDFWGRWTKTGVHGDPTKATAEKGKILFEAAVSRMVELVSELRAWPIAKREDMHRAPVQSDIRW
jgi:creatinine amidohydrolase